MKALLKDTDSFKSGLKHYLLADVLFTLIIGAFLQIIILFISGDKVLMFSQGGLALIFDMVVTSLAIILSCLCLKSSEKRNAQSVATIATIFAGLTIVVSLPYSGFFATIQGTTATFLIVKHIFHLIFFYLATIYFFKKEFKRAHSFIKKLF